MAKKKRVDPYQKEPSERPSRPSVANEPTRQSDMAPVQTLLQTAVFAPDKLSPANARQLQRTSGNRALADQALANQRLGGGSADRAQAMAAPSLQRVLSHPSQVLQRALNGPSGPQAAHDQDGGRKDVFFRQGEQRVASPVIQRNEGEGTGSGGTQPKLSKKAQLENWIKQYNQKIGDGSLGPRYLAMIKEETDSVTEHIAGYRQYGEVWMSGLIQALKDAAAAVKKAQAAQAIGSDLENVQQGATGVEEMLHRVVHPSELNDTQNSWLSKEQKALLVNARSSLAPALAPQTERTEPLTAAQQTYGGLSDLPTAEQQQAAQQAKAAYSPAVAPNSEQDTLLQQADAILESVTPNGIKSTIAAMLKAAHQDVDKQLTLDKMQKANFISENYRKRKLEVEQVLAEKVEKQHKPTQAKWRSFLALSKSTGRLYMRPNTGTIDGYQVHTSLFHNTIQDDTDVNESLADLKRKVLGSGTGGFHVTLEQYDHKDKTRNNPHAYRGLAAARRNDFTQAHQSKEDWPKVKAELESLRDDEVKAAEETITQIKDNKGAR